MPAHNAAMQALLWNAESSFGEVSTSFSGRLPIVDLNFNPQQTMIPVGRAVQYQNDETLPVRGTMAGTITFRHPAHGLGSTAATSIALNDLATFLGHVVGNSDASSVGTTFDGGGSAGAPTLSTGTGTFAAGSICRAGAINDGAGNGQFAAVSSLSSDILTLLTALDGTPSNLDVCYAAALVYPFETPTTSTVTGLRFRFLSANQHYDANGCFPTALRLTNVGTGGIPYWEFEFGISAWRPVSGTMPTATATETYAPAPTTAGSVFENTVGTSTRAKVTTRDLEVNFELEIVPLVGPGAPRDRQTIISAVRGKTRMSFAYTVDSEAAGTDTYGDLWNTAENSQVYKHHMISLSASDGYSLGLYAPRTMIVGERPTQMTVDGRNMKRVMWRCCTGPTTTNDLTLSNFRIAMA